MHIEDVQAAARIIEWGFHPRILPEAMPEYRDLVRRWTDDGEFRAVVAALASGLKLRVVGVSLRTGIVLGPETDSVFAYTITRFRRSVAAEEGAVIALVLVAICASFFPTQDSLDLDDSSAAPSVSIAEARERLVKLCEALQSQGNNNDVAATRWRKGYEELLRLPKILEDARQASRRSVHGLVLLIFNHLADIGFVATEERSDGNHLFVATPRMRMMLAENAAVPLLDIARALKGAGETGSTGREVVNA